MDQEKNIVDIQLERTEFFPGEEVRGKLVLNLDREIKAKGLYLEFAGLEDASVWVENAFTSMDYHENRYIVQKRLRVWPHGTTDRKKRPLGPCQKTFPFKFEIPPDALPSLDAPWPYELPATAAEKGLPSVLPNMGKEGQITWFVKARLYRARGRDPKCKRRIQVLIPSRDLPTPVPVSESSSEDPSKPQISIQLDKNVYALGESVTGSVRFSYEGTKKIRSANVSLQYNFHFEAEGHPKDFAQRVDVLEVERDMFDQERRFQFQLPMGGPPTVTGQLIWLDWQVEAIVNVTLGKNVTLTIPIEAHPV